MLPWPSDFLSWAFTSSLPVPLVCKVPLLPLLPDLKIQSHFLLFEKLQLSMFREKWFVSICFWTLWFGPEILKCHHYGCSLLDISLNASKEKTIWKVRKRQVQGRFFSGQIGEKKLLTVIFFSMFQLCPENLFSLCRFSLCCSHAFSVLITQTLDLRS